MCRVRRREFLCFQCHVRGTAYLVGDTRVLFELLRRYTGSFAWTVGGCVDIFLHQVFNLYNHVLILKGVYNWCEHCIDISVQVSEFIIQPCHFESAIYLRVFMFLYNCDQF